MPSLKQMTLKFKFLCLLPLLLTLTPIQLYAEVMAEISMGNLLITGDGDNDSILVADDADLGIRIRGRDGTLVNGVTETNIAFANPIQHVVIDLGAGADHVTCVNLSQLSGRLDIFGGTGGDNLVVKQCNLPSLCRIIASGGADQIRIVQSIVGRNLIVSGGGGGDYASIRECDILGFVKIVMDSGSNTMPATSTEECVSITNSDIFGNLIVNCGNGPDTIYMAQSFVGGDTTLATFPGEDGIQVVWTYLAGLSRVLLGNDNDDILVSNSTLGSAEYVGLGGDDTVFLYLSDVFDSISMNGGNEHDSFFSVASVIGDDPMTDELVVELKNGLDEVYAIATIFSCDVTLDGGPSDDSIFGENNFFDGVLTEISFELSAEALDWQAILLNLFSIVC